MSEVSGGNLLPNLDSDIGGEAERRLDDDHTYVLRKMYRPAEKLSEAFQSIDIFLA